MRHRIQGQLRLQSDRLYQWGDGYFMAGVLTENRQSHFVDKTRYCYLCQIADADVRVSSPCCDNIYPSQLRVVLKTVEPYQRRITRTRQLIATIPRLCHLEFTVDHARRMDAVVVRSVVVLIPEASPTPRDHHSLL